MELERIEQKEVLTKESMDLIEFQKNIENKNLCKKIDTRHLEFLQNNDLSVEDMLLIKKFCEYMKGR